MTTGLAMQMKLRLRELMRQHGIALQPVAPVPLAEPTAGPMILSGFASTTGVDLVRQKFRPYAFCNPCVLLSKYPPPKLYWKHDETRTVGEILQLKYDDHGNLRIVCRVNDAIARRANAFSIGALVERYSMHNENSGDFHALIEQAEICEISLTDNPCNPAALVQSRAAAPPLEPLLKTFADNSALISRRIGIVQEMLRLAVTSATAAPVKQSRKTQPLRIEPHRATQFGQLVSAMENNHAT